MSEQEIRIAAAIDEHATVERRVTDENKSTATCLVEMAMARYAFGTSTVGEPYAIPRTGPKVVAMLRGSKTSLRGLMARKFFQKTGRVASQQALADALAVIEGLAQEAEESELHLRVAKYDGELWIDLGDQSGRAVKVTSQGWTACDEAPVLFKRTILNGPLPDPVKGDLESFWRLLNVSKDDRPLLAAWLVTSLLPDIAHPVLCFFGEQGTAKTTAQKMIVKAIDPGPVPTRKPPRDPESWVTAAAGSWVVGLDNLSKIPEWLSDCICRAVTGDGDVRRKLYTDGEHAVFAFRRCICINGIDLGSLRGDLTERLLPIEMDVIPDSERREEDEVRERWEQAHAEILGGILTLTSDVLRILPSVSLASKPRMADFALILRAVDEILGTRGLAQYIDRQRAFALDSISSDPFILVLLDMCDDFTGTSAELLSRMSDRIPDRPSRDWPSNARAVTTLLKRNAPALRKAGWYVSNDGAHNQTNAIRWTLKPPENKRNPSSCDSSCSHTDEATSDTSHEYEPSQDERCSHCDGEGCHWCDADEVRL